MARVEIDGVTLAYEGGGGVRDISLDIEDGEFVALLGPSGSGKTTLLRLVGGFLRPNRGSISIGSTPVAAEGRWVPAEQRNLGMVFQQHAVWPHRTVAQNVEYPLKLAKVPRARRRDHAREVLDMVGLDGFADRSPETLSGGQRQRVALARALVAEPAALLLDEPFASLDAALRGRLRVELGALAARTGTTVIHVTHDRTEALALADRVAVLNDGELEQLASPRSLFRTPGTSFVAGFVADAVLLPVAVPEKGRFTLQPGGAEVEVGEAEAPGGWSNTGTLALRPRDVRLGEGGGAVVEAVLFTGDALEVYLEWQGHQLRSQVPATESYRIGDEVRTVFDRGVFFGSGSRTGPEDDAVTSPAPGPGAAGRGAGGTRAL